MNTITNDEGGNDAVPILMRVGNVSPSPMPVQIMPPMTGHALFGSHRRRPEKRSRNKTDGATAAAPTQAISLPANSSEVIGAGGGRAQFRGRS